jgi:hypothetical protein
MAGASAAPLDVITVERGDVRVMATQHVIFDIWEFDRHIENGLHALRIGNTVDAEASFRTALRFADRPFLAECQGVAWVDAARADFHRTAVGGAQHALRLSRVVGGRPDGMPDGMRFATAPRSDALAARPQRFPTARTRSTT